MSSKIVPAVEFYMEQVASGRIRACKDQKLMVEHVAHCFETEDIVTDEEQLANYLSLVKYYPFERLFPWEEFQIALHLCTYRGHDGRPRWREWLDLLGRGAGKDGFIAFLGMCLISQYNGIPFYNVDICANNEKQAMQPVRDLVNALEAPGNMEKLKRHFKWTKEQATGRKTRGKVVGHTNSPKGKDGLRSGIVILNEIHQYENYDNIDVFTTGLGKIPHPRIAYFSTQGYVREGPLDDLLDTSEGILLRGDPDEGFMPFICRLDAPEEVHDPENWQKANPSLIYKPDLMDEIMSEYVKWKKDPTKLPAFLVKRMNLSGDKLEAEVTAWKNIAATNRPLPDLSGWGCTVGIDYASLGDFASVIFHFRKGEMRFDIHHSWLCLQSKDLPRIKAPWRDWSNAELWNGEPRLTLVDEPEISPYLLTEYITEMGKRYFIKKVCMDSFRFALMKSALESIGFAPEKKQLHLVRPSDIMMIQPVIGSCFTNQRFTWGDDPVLRWGTNNTKLKPKGRDDGFDTGNFVYAKIEAKSRKNDPFMALAAAMTVEDELQGDFAIDFANLGVIVA